VFPVGLVSSLPTFPFVAPPSNAPFRWRLGVRPLDLDDWIQFGADGDHAIATKSLLNERHPDTVFAVLDGVDTESREVATVVTNHLRRQWPERGCQLDHALHPLDAAARLVPEDLVMMVERPGPGGPRLVFGGGSVCFPNRWDLRSKLGLTMAEVHAPVAQLNEQLEAPIDHFLQRLRPERSFWRLGWGILDTPDWYTPLDGTGPAPTVEPQPEQMYLRIERETLRRLPQTNCVLFTIRTFVTPIAEIVHHADTADRLAWAIETLPVDVRGYKDIAHVADRLVEHLRSIPPET
jgi:hypothetical protein